ncbi:TPA: DUF104 domain-containing protein [Candidatus Poribacteria bacterium]|nr:DUF104 domain-containing protein [Candidatus Poribacteria bacterium]HEX28630.1 DUF104 domain-containing protein [Candidatus Poribacteria bacterium]
MPKVIKAIYADGVLKPIEPLNLPERTAVRLILETEDERRELARKILELIQRSYDGLSEEQIKLLEENRLRSGDLKFLEKV